ncbi:MAG: VanZ family protein [Acidobacteria bacterium]|nr:VanZ family protein [Acidobacteriota bacterium]
MSRALFLWLPVVAYMAAIFYLSSLSFPPAPQEVSDKTLHVAAYGGLALVALRALAGGRWTGVTLGTLIGCWAIGTAYGLTDEWHQRFIEGRSPELADVSADALGAAIGAIAAGAWSIIRRL